MRKRFLFIFILGFTVNTIFAQSTDITVQGVSPELYIMHTVAPKENWYSVGRLYNMSPKMIAPFNGITIDKPLSIGQQIKVPLTNTNFSQNGEKAEDEIFVPVIHIVQDKEWMYRISTNYNKVPVESLEKWNHISKDDAKAGTKLVVGYLKVKKTQSALASNGLPPATQVATTNAPPVTASTIPPATTDPVTTVPEKKAETVTKVDPKPEKQSVPVEDKPVVNKPVTQPPANVSAGEGFFKMQYEENGKTATGAAGIFKSTSGWQDGKYYALVNNVAIGTIIKVSNPSNNKTVFAKVLGQLPDMKESAGLTARLSDAAASELGITATKFPVELKY